jgi:SAM-dependent methyltransferase
MATSVLEEAPVFAHAKTNDLPCPICGERTFEPYAVLRDNRTGAFDQPFRVARCSGCGLVALRPQPDQDELFAGYERGYGPYPPPRGRAEIGRLGRQEVWKRRLKHAWHVLDGNATIDRVAVTGRVLDVGSGKGDNVEFLLRQGLDAVGIDPNPRVVELGQARGLPIVHGTLETIEVVPESFDTVILSQVIEHLIEPVASLRTIHRLLRPGGRVVMLTPNIEGLPNRFFGDDWGHWHLPYHVYLYGPRQLRRLLQMTGFRVERLSTVTPAYWLHMSLTLWRHKSQATGWSLESGGRHNFHPAVRLALAPVARAVDIVGRGDCHIAVGEKPPAADD